MHEGSIALAVLDIIKDEAARHHVARVVEIRLSVGPFTGIEWHTLSAFFELAAEHTVAENASLVRLSAPAAAICRDCDHAFDLHHIRDRCPMCAGIQLECTGGRTFAIAGIEAV